MDILIRVLFCLWVLCCYTAFLDCAFVTEQRMNWTEGFKHCKMATKEDAYGYSNYHRSFVGALQLNTPWMIHEGCFYSANPFQIHKHIKENSPGECSYHCMLYKYFALKGTECMCDNSKTRIIKVGMNLCSTKCSGSNKDICGTELLNYINLYRHVTGKDAPVGNLDRDYSCSVFKITSSTVHLHSTKCSKMNILFCDFHQTALKEHYYKTFSWANQYCHLMRSKLEIDDVKKLHLKDGQYWTGIHRRQIIKWLETESSHNLCVAMQSIDTIRCTVIDWQSAARIEEVYVPCTDWLPVLCSKPIHTGHNHQNVISECNNGTFIEHTDSSNWNNDVTHKTNNETELTNTTIHSIDNGHLDIHLIIQIGVISLSVFVIGISVLSLLVHFNCRKQTSTNSNISQCHESNQYSELQAINYDHLQIHLPAIYENTEFVDSLEMESYYVNTN